MDSEWFIRVLSIMLGMLSLVGALAGLFRWPNAVRKDFLASFIVYLSGTALREWVVYVWGGRAWPELAVLISTSSRVVQFLGILMFIRASIDGKCPWWAMYVLLAVVATLAVLM